MRDPDPADAKQITRGRLEETSKDNQQMTYLLNIRQSQLGLSHRDLSDSTNLDGDMKSHATVSGT